MARYYVKADSLKDGRLEWWCDTISAAAYTYAGCCEDIQCFDISLYFKYDTPNQVRLETFSRAPVPVGA
jgi:hypothetical protein